VALQERLLLIYRFNRSIAAEGCYFWLDPKVTNRSSRKKPSAHGQNTPARFSGRPLPALQSLLFTVMLNLSQHDAVCL